MSCVPTTRVLVTLAILAGVALAVLTLTLLWRSATTPAYGSDLTCQPSAHGPVCPW